MLSKERGWMVATLVLSVIVVLAIATAVWAMLRVERVQQDAVQVQKSPSAVVRDEAQRVVEQVGALIALPEGEDPTIATVSDPEKLRDQPFFDQAEAGDRVLIYAKAKRAILYRPSVNRVIDIAPIASDRSGVPAAPPNE